MNAAARRRFDLMLARVEHDATGMPEAETALAGARAVFGKHPDLPRGAARLAAAEELMAVRRQILDDHEQHSTAAAWADLSAASASVVAALAELGRTITDTAFTIERDPVTGVYRKRYHS